MLNDHSLKHISILSCLQDILKSFLIILVKLGLTGYRLQYKNNYVSLLCLLLYIDQLVRMQTFTLASFLHNTMHACIKCIFSSLLRSPC